MALETQGLDVYYGGFLVNDCIPLELSGNWCTHGCVYCYANLKKPGRELSTRQVLGAIQNHPTGVTLRDHLLRERYPVLISNHVDPLSKSNDQVLLPIIEMLSELGIPYDIATKGGKRMGDLLDLIKHPSVFYFSITTLDEKLSKAIEPGAPLPKERLEQVQEVVRRGHWAIVSPNPTVESWIPDTDLYAGTIKSAGAYASRLNELHLSQKQLKGVTKHGIRALGQDVIDRAYSHTRKHYKDEIRAYIDRLRASLERAGIEVYENGEGKRCGYFDGYFACYPTRYPVIQEFVNQCHDTLEDGALITFEDFWRYCEPKLPSGENWTTGYHIFSTTISGQLGQIGKGHKTPIRMSYKDCIKLIWNQDVITISPIRWKCFAIHSEKLRGNRREVLDDDGNIIYVFKPGGVDSYYVD